MLTPHQINSILWITYIVVWMTWGIFVIKAKVEEGWTRLAHVLPLGFSFYLVFSPHRPLFYGRLYDVTWTSWPAYLGLALALVGIAIAMWARVHLGKYWSGMVTLKVGHRLITSGPYRFVRHPIYTGWLVGMLGEGITAGTLDGFVGVALVLLSFIIKIRREEKLLAGEFAQEFAAYKAATRAALFPGIY